MADSKLEIGTGLNLSGIKKDIKELEKLLGGAQKEIEQLNDEEAKVREKYAPEKEYNESRIVQSKWDKSSQEAEAKEIAAKEKEELSGVIAKREELNQKVQEYKAKLEQANATLQQQSAIAQASKELDGAVKGGNALSKIRTEEQYQSLLAQTKAQMERIEASAEQIAAKHGLSRDQLLANNREYQKLSDLLTQLNGKQGQFKKTTEKTMKSAEKSTKTFGQAIKGGIKQIFKMGLAMFGVRSAFMAFRRAASAYMESNQKLKNQMESLWNVAGQVVGPVVEWLIKHISTLVVWVDSLVKSLTGISIIAKANAAALKKQATAAKSASLAGFDEMNKLSDSSGGGADGKFDPSLAGKIPQFLEDAKKKILEGDWFGAGQIIGQALMDGIENIDWAGLGRTVGEILWGAVALLFGIAVSIDAGTILTSANELLTNFFNALTDGIQSLDWFEIGEELIDALLLAIGIMNPTIGILELILAPGGKEMTNSVAEFAGSLVGALASAIAGLGTKIAEIASDLWTLFMGYFDEGVDWLDVPGDIIGGLCAGIMFALEDIGTWIYENIWIPFRDGFKEAFDIHSPSKKMKDFGINLIEGLCEGVTGAIDKVKQACTDILEAIQGKFAGVGDWFKEKFTEAWQNVKDVFSSGGEIFSGIKEGVETTFKNVVNKLIDGTNTILSKPFNKINSMLNSIRSIQVLGVSPFSGLWSYNPLSVPQIPKLALGGIVNRPGRGVPAIIGEAGAEAVLPLENNTEWMDMLAEKIGGNVTIPIYMDGKKIATYVVDIQKKKAFAMNGV